MTSHAHNLTCPWGWSFMLHWRQSSGELPPKRGGCHFAFSSPCQLCAPASSRAGLCPWGANPRCSPIRNPWLSNSSLPTPLPKPAQGGLQRTGSRSSPSDTRNHSQDSGKPFLNLQTPAHSIPASAALQNPVQGKEKLTSQSWEALQTLMRTASAGIIREPAGPWRNCRGKKGECPNHSMQRRETQYGCSLLAGPPPPVPARRGDHSRMCI